MESAPITRKTRMLRDRLNEIHDENFYDRPDTMRISLHQLRMVIAFQLYNSPFNYRPDVPTGYLRRLFDGEGDIFREYPLDAQKNVMYAIGVIKSKILHVRSDEADIDVGMTYVHTVCAEACPMCGDFPHNDVHQWLILRILVNGTHTVHYDVQNDGIYDEWIHFLTCNNLPRGHMFYTESGMYRPGSLVRQRATPALMASVLNVSGLITASLLAASVSFPCMSFMKQPAVVLASYVAAWNNARASVHLEDRNNNNLALFCDDEKQHWQNLARALMTIVGAQLEIADEWNRHSAVTPVYRQFMRHLYALAENNLIHNL